MTSIYTDEARQARYDRLRAKKRRLDKCLDVLMWITLIGGFITLLSGFMTGVLGGVLYGDLKAFFEWLLNVAVFGVTVWAIYAKNVRFTLIAMIVSAVAAFLELATASGFVYALIPLILTLIVDIQWEKLSKEEGFPLFEISIREYETREKHQLEIARNRALNAGVRVATAEGDGADMGDILDAGFDKPVIAERIGVNPGRFEGSVQGAVVQQGFTPGEMDSIALAPLDAGLEQKPVTSVNTPELEPDAAALSLLEAMDGENKAPAADDDVLAALKQLNP